MNLLFKLCFLAGKPAFYYWKCWDKNLYSYFGIYLWWYIKDDFLQRVHLIEGIQHPLRSRQWHQPQASVVYVPILPVSLLQPVPHLARTGGRAGSRPSTSCWMGAAVWGCGSCRTCDAVPPLISSSYPFRRSQWHKTASASLIKLHRG